MATTYSYTLSGDLTSGIDKGFLAKEIEDDATITQTLNYITVYDAY